MPPLQLLIKPASSLCNLKCSYCFYADEAQNRRIPCYGVMQEDTLACVIRKALAQAEDVCTFGFQGGEPTLAGLPFFEKVVALERRYNTRNLSITHTIQTNGMVLDDAWATFLAREHFLVGLSLDGYAALHDLHRVDAQGNGTHARVLEAAALLARHHVETNILTVVTAQTARAPERLYRFFERQGLRYQQYIPCLPPLH
ncbi:MAG: radical SAM protein, partial [Clostridia bacterium]